MDAATGGVAVIMVACFRQPGVQNTLRPLQPHPSLLHQSVHLSEQVPRPLQIRQRDLNSLSKKRVAAQVADPLAAIAAPTKFEIRSQPLSLPLPVLGSNKALLR